MKKLVSLFLLTFFFAMNAQETANRFFYELTFKPKRDSTKMDKVMTSLDIIKDKSLFRDFTTIAQDSLLKAEIETMQKTGVYKDISKSMKMPKFAFKVTKKYPEMTIQYSEGMLNGMTPVQLAYNDNPKFDWKIIKFS